MSSTSLFGRVGWTKKAALMIMWPTVYHTPPGFVGRSKKTRQQQEEERVGFCNPASRSQPHDSSIRVSGELGRRAQAGDFSSSGWDDD
jgi:hypothetical protein